MKRLLIILAFAVVMSILLLLAILDTQYAQNQKVRLPAIEKAMTEEFKDMAVQEDIVGNTMNDTINSRYAELHNAFISGKKQWPTYADPNDIGRFAELGEMYRAHLSEKMTLNVAKCVVCHKYQEVKNK
jgi:hypothetical protein